MPFPSSFHGWRRSLGASAFLLAAGCPSSAQTSDTPPPRPAAIETVASPSLKSLDYSGSQQALEALDKTIAAAGTDATKVSLIAQDLLNTLKEPGLTDAARQATGERLGRLLAAPSSGDSTLSVLAPMLRDERQVNAARLALEPIPGGAVDALFLHALSPSSGPTRLALVQSVGNRRIAEAVPALAVLLKDPDAPTAAAAAMALGQVGTTAASAALLGAPNPVARIVVDARLACAWCLPVAEGTAALRAIFEDSRVFVAQRAAAFRVLLDREPAAASQRIADVLVGDDATFKRVAIESIFAHPAPDLVASLAAKLAAWDTPTQAAVITAFGRKGDAAVVPVVLAAVTQDDPDVRTAAIVALGLLPGNREIATRLARVATDADVAEAKLARQSLARLSGPEVADTILVGAEQAASPLRGVFLEEIGLRNMTEGMPLLLKTRADSDVSTRSAALSALTAIAPPTEQVTILGWAIAATDSQETTRALQALVSVTQRNRDAVTRDRAIIDAIDHGTAAVQLHLLPVLARLASAATGRCAGRLALSTDEAVATAATAALARWPDDSVLPLLAVTADKSTLATARAAAVQGAIRFLERSRGVPSAEQSSLVALLLGTTSEAETRQNLLRMLGRGSSDFALKFAESLQTDPALADEARDAALAIRVNQDWPPLLTASASSSQLNNLVDGKLRTFWTVPVTANQWVQVDFKKVRPIRRITLDQTGRAGDYPERFEVYVTNDPASPGAVRATGTGRRDQTVIELPSGTRGRIVIIRNTAERKDANWAIAELQID